MAAFRGNLQSEDIDRLKEILYEMKEALKDLEVDSIMLTVHKKGTDTARAELDKNNVFWLKSENDGDKETREYRRL